MNVEDLKALNPFDNENYIENQSGFSKRIKWEIMKILLGSYDMSKTPILNIIKEAQEIYSFLIEKD